ncbi:MAG TPA: hypothetical protein VGC76_06570 [Pyrinomonadaceae bacterium]
MDQSAQICELRPGACHVIESERLACDPGNKSASYGRDCNGTLNTVTSDYISCPISCTCPQPIGTKPCKRAIWNTDTCSWNDAVCYNECRSGYTTSGEKITKETDSAARCSPCNPDPTEVFMCQQGGGTYDWSSCQCGQSPIVIDVLGNGFNLTNSANGIHFDINGDGVQEQIAWSSANSDDAWLALDRNSNNFIDNGEELFGNHTPQPAPPQGEKRNGFLALAEYDKQANGGNGDGKISQQDSIFGSLRLWQDKNHNGISEPSEMHTLVDLGLRKIDLDYHESRRTDDFGNQFRYRAKVRDAQDAQLGRWAWDVFLQTTPINAAE